MELGWGERLLLAEAAGALVLASVAIRMLPFRRVVRAAGSGSPAEATAADAGAADIRRVKWAVEASARYLPLKLVCFQKGLAVHKLLQRRGVATSLHYGVAQDPDQGLAAHVWVTHRGQPIIGGEEASRFTCLATFPAAAPS
jgi:hypothetical protein